MADFDFESRIVSIPDFPEPGVIFKDITPLFADPDALDAAVDAIAAHFADAGVTKIVAPEARGFMIGAPIAYKLGVGFIPARKPGKLPRATVSVSYELEYGTDTLEIHEDAIEPGDRILLIDDLIAGTADGRRDRRLRLHPRTRCAETARGARPERNDRHLHAYPCEVAHNFSKHLFEGRPAAPLSCFIAAASRFPVIARMLIVA